MNPELKVETHIMSPKRLESLMLKDQPIVPPDSVIKTFSHLKGDHVDVVMTQDKEGLAPSSFVLKRGDWAMFFLDTWFDPLYRSYNFQKAETHALVSPQFPNLRKDISAHRLHRNTLFSGTQPFSQSSSSSPNAP